MRPVLFFITFIVVMFIMCEEENAFFTDQLTDGFCIKINEDHIIDHHDIEYYDYSTHIVYLKFADTIFNQHFQVMTFAVYADFKEIYNGSTLPLYSCAMVTGPTINFPYPDFVISIGNNFFYDSTGHTPPDPRKDERIVTALTRYKQFHCGLKGIIDTVINTSGSLTLKFTIVNDDSFNYYILSPDNMGMRLFHYFTNGLRISDDVNHKSYGHHIETLQPDPFDSWNKEWFDLIRRNEKKSFTLFYDQFDVIPKGQYNASFRFSGLSYQVKNKKDLNGEDARIWLGNIDVKKQITIN